MEDTNRDTNRDTNKTLSNDTAKKINETETTGKTPGNASQKEKGTSSALGWKIAVVVLAIVVVILGVKVFWPSGDKGTDAGQAVSGSRNAGEDGNDARDKNAENAAGDKDSDGKGKSDDENDKGANNDQSKDNNDQNQNAKDDQNKDGVDSGNQNESNSENGNQNKSDDENNKDADANKTDDDQDDPAKNAAYVLTYSEANTWEEGGAKMRTLDLALANQTKDPISDWTLILTVEGLKSVSGWNGTYEIKGDTLTITPETHNSEIFPDGAVYLGCNLGTKSDLKITKATLNGMECAIKNGSVNQDSINNQGGNSQKGDQDPNGQGNAADVEAMLKRAESAKQGDDWLHTDGRRILDKDGKEVWLTGVNWFGYNTGTNVFDGLWNSKMEPTVKAIADHGFNLIRVPMSAQLINEWAAGKYPQANFNQAYNAAMTKMNSLEIFDYFLTLAEGSGIKVMIDIHSAETNAAGHNVNLWYTDKVKTEDYYAALEWMAARYKNNDTIIAYDLKNEPHGKPYEGDGAAIWNDSKKANNWKYVAETAAAKVLAKNPNVLIMVEGTEIYPKNSKGDYSSKNDKDYYFNWWGGNLRAVKDYPIDLGKYQDKLVYSPHDYGPTVYEQPWFKGSYDYNSLMKDCWHDNWFYIYEDNTAPLLIGEWGGFMKEPNLKWMTCMRQLIATYHLNHTFWCLNANSGDTGGLLLDDFTTWDKEKYEFVKEVLWQEGGKFVGLDHEIPLGEGGISLKDAKGR